VGKLAPVEALPPFEITEEKVWATFTVAVVGATAAAVRSTYGLLVVATSLQAPLQLLPSLDSAIVPPDIEGVLSAQNLTDHVRGAPENVYEYEACAVPPAAKAAIEAGVAA
jgi:hypothetical protein